MGSPWALYLAQRCNSTKLCSLPALAWSHCLSDRGPPWVIGADGPSTAHYTYVDNLGVLSKSRATVAEAIYQAECDFKSVGLLLHEVDVTSSRGEVLGIELDGHRFETRNSLKRLHRIQLGISAILNRRRVCVWVGVGGVSRTLHVLWVGMPRVVKHLSCGVSLYCQTLLTISPPLERCQRRVSRFQRYYATYLFLLELAMV